LRGSSIKRGGVAAGCCCRPQTNGMVSEGCYRRCPWAVPQATAAANDVPDRRSSLSSPFAG